MGRSLDKVVYVFVVQVVQVFQAAPTDTSLYGYGDVGKDCACLSAILVLMFMSCVRRCGQGLRVSLRGSGAPVHALCGLLGKDCACFSVILVLMSLPCVRLHGYGDVGKACACLPVILVLVCSVPMDTAMGSSTLPFDAQWQFPMVQPFQLIIEIPRFVFGGRCPCLQVFHRCSRGSTVAFSQLQPVDARPRCAGLQVPQVRSVRRQSRFHCCCLFTPDLQYIDKVVDVPVVVRMPVVVQHDRCHDGRWVFSGPCTQVHGQGSPAIRAGKGWRGRRELAPRCSATQLGA